MAGTIDLPNGIPFPSFPLGISFTPDFTELWVTSQFPGRVDIIDPGTDQVVDTIPVNFTAAVDIEFAFGGSVAYVVGHQTDFLGIPDAIMIIDTATRAQIGGVLGGSDPDVGTGVVAVATAANGAAYASNAGPLGDDFLPIPPFPDTVTKMDLAGNTTRIPSGGLSPAGITASPDGRYIYVSNASSGTVGVIDTTTDTLIATVAVGFVPAFPAAFTQPGLLDWVHDSLDEIIQDNPDTPLADKLADARASVQSAIDRLDETPPDRSAAAGDIAGAIGALQAAVDAGLLDLATATRWLDDGLICDREEMLESLPEIPKL